jgi:hypothetical protein
MTDQIKKQDDTTPAPATKDILIKKLRDISLEDLEGVTGGSQANCDGDSKAPLM